MGTRAQQTGYPRKAHGWYSFPRKVVVGFTISLPESENRAQLLGVQGGFPVGGHSLVRSQGSLLGPSRDPCGAAGISFDSGPPWSSAEGDEVTPQGALRTRMSLAPWSEVTLRARGGGEGQEITISRMTGVTVCLAL